MNSVPYIDRFRQTKDKLKKNSDFLIVGIDVGKHSHVACMINSLKNIYQKKFKFANTSDGIAAMLTRCKKIQKKENKGEVIFALEPTGNYHKPLSNYLYKQGYMVCYVSPAAVTANRKSVDGRWRKNDPDDAYNIADLLNQGKVLFYDLEYQQISDQLKPLIVLHRKLQKRLCSLKARIRNNIFAQFFPEIDSFYKDIDNPEIISILKYFPSAEQIRDVSFEKFFSVLSTTGRMTIKKQERIGNIWHKARKSIGCCATNSLDFEANFLLQDLTLVKSQIKELEGERNSICEKMEGYKLMLDIPGAGPVYTSIFLSVIKDIKRFNNSKQIEKLAGLDLEYSQSGKYHSKARISKKGNALLRYSLCGIVNGALKNSFFKELFAKQLIEKGDNQDTRRILKVKLAVKMIRIIYAILSKRSKFNIVKIKEGFGEVACS